MDPVSDITAETAEPAAPSRGRRIARRMLTAFVVTLAVVVAFAALLYYFGGPVAPTADQRAEYESLVRAGLAPPAPEPRFVVPVPGCVCHSGDSVQIVQHSEYRLRECSECH